jgi:ADP-ribose pyrophosphatase
MTFMACCIHSFKEYSMNFTPQKREKVYSGRAFDVEILTMQLPDGKVRNYDLVQHRGAVTIVPVDPAGNILFVRQYRIGAGMELLELPAGVLNQAEPPAEAAAREVREETGMAAGKMELLGDFYMVPGYSTEHMFVYLATELHPDPLDQDDDEFLELIAIPTAEALRMAGSGEIHDGKSLAALMMVQSYLHSVSPD